MGFDVSHLAAPYDEASQQVDYAFDDGLLAIPVAGPPGTPAKIVRVHGGIGRKTLSFAMQRQGAVPRLPDPTPQNRNEVLLAGHVKNAVPSLMADGTPVARVEGQFVSVLLKPLSHKDPLPMGSGPQDAAPGSAYLVRPSDWSTHWIVAPTPTPVPLQEGFVGA